MGNVVAVLGGQWGDEGKGKLVDVLAENFDVVVRFQGGHNAGHTVKVGDTVYAFHLIPSGILHEGTACVLGNGVVVHPPTLLTELQKLREASIPVEGRLWISNRAHLVMPYHSLLDVAREAARGAKKIGTTSRGIGPAYEDRVARIGLRVGDLLNEDRFREWTLRNVETKNRLLSALGADPVDGEEIVRSYLEYGAEMSPFICDTLPLLHQSMDEGKWILLEGAQGALLDVDHGTWPYVTSSNPTIGGALAGSGIGPTRVRDIVMILKAYSTRVGTGPFPTELENEIGERIRTAGNEFGTTTGRPRRCGWFDAVIARHSARINDCTAIALTLLDVLDGFEEIRICTGYRWRGETLDTVPADPWHLKEVEPVYETVPGWEGACKNVTSWEELPDGAKSYVEAIERHVGCPVIVVSTGPGRDQLIQRREASFLSPPVPRS